MVGPILQVGRNLSEHRVAAYECAVGSSGIKKGKWVTGWYGMFDDVRLKEELIPKLAECAKYDASYPFLIASYMLENNTDVWIEGDPKRSRARDVKFRARRRKTPQQYEAIVHSRRKYQLLR